MQITSKKTERTKITTQITVEVVGNQILWCGRDIQKELARHDSDAWVDIMVQLTQNASQNGKS